jgi:hypothetical protein
MGRRLPAQRPPTIEEHPVEERHDAPAPAAAQPSMQGSLLAIQRSAGNAAVSRLVAALPAGGRTLSRYESGEHAMAGGARKITIGGWSSTRAT